VDVLADVAMVDGAAPLLTSSPCLLPHLLDNDATVFIVIVVGPCRQDGGGGEQATTTANPMGGRDTPEIKEFRRRRPNCDIYVNVMG
jgi:hypothetical protein